VRPRAGQQLREERFNVVWTKELKREFADIAPYYDRANYVASLGLWSRFLQAFMSVIDLRPRQRTLDVCAGTNAIGIALLRRKPALEVHAIQRSRWRLRFGCCNALEVQAFDKAQCSALTLGAEGGYNHGPFCGRFTCVFW